ncbi:MAG: PilZ domain-containing protein [Proteobacteria bacterium]|nr:PilZ domain-containing protein [Pseudomonadota bacterium]
MVYKIRPSRVEKKIVVRYRLPDKPESGFEMTQVKDISTSGMLFSTATLIAPHTLVDVDIKLPLYSQSIYIRGKIIKCHEVKTHVIYYSAVRFINMDADTLSALRKTVAFFWEKNGKMPPPERKILNRATRAPRTLMLRYKPMYDRDMGFILNQAINISTSGILFRTERLYPVDQLMELHLNIPMFPDIKAIRGRVARCRRLRDKEFETAVKYTHIEEPVLRAIQNMTR